MEMTLTLRNFPRLLTVTMAREIQKYTPCKVREDGFDVIVNVDADVVKCMEAIVVADKYCVGSTDEEPEDFPA